MAFYTRPSEVQFSSQKRRHSWPIRKDVFFRMSVVITLLTSFEKIWKNMPRWEVFGLLLTVVRGFKNAPYRKVQLRRSRHLDGSSVVWFTGGGDLRNKDHGGLMLAESRRETETDIVVPLFIIDDGIYLKNQVGLAPPTQTHPTPLPLNAF